MIILKPFLIDDWTYLQKWIKNEAELIQFSGPIFKFPIDREQIKNYLSVPKRTVFKIEIENRTIGIAEISDIDKNTAKLARILIGEEAMRGKGLGTKLIHQLNNYAFNKLNKNLIILNVYTWNIGAIKCYTKVGYSITKNPSFNINVGTETWKNIEMSIYKKTI